MRRCRTRLHADDGLFAILYALLVLVLVGTAAVVVDLAMLRESRTSTRSAVDSAVLVAAASLNAVQPSLNDPREGCERAWSYLLDNLSGPSDGSSSCEVLDIPCRPTSPLVAEQASSGWTVRFTWPVPNDHELMTKPDLAPRTTTRASDPAFDGTDPCSRMGIEVLKNNVPFFAGVFGSETVQTRAASVARGAEQASGGVFAALNILQQTGCGALTTADKGSILVNGTTGTSGIIAVESDGLRGTDDDEDEDACHIIEAAGAAIRASTSGRSSPGLIQTFGANRSSGSVNPTATALVDRFGAKPVRDLFQTSIADLVAAYEGPGVPRSYVGAQPPYSTMAFAKLPSTTSTDPQVARFDDCDINAPVIIPPGNWFIDCAPLVVKSTLTFQGGVVVTRGSIEVTGENACLAVNTATCPSAIGVVPNEDAILYIRSGNLLKDEKASLALPQTFVYLQKEVDDLPDGVVDLTQGPAGSLLWTAPKAQSCATDATCSNQRFQRLLLWSEGDDRHRIRGQFNLTLRGVLFTPNAPFRLEAIGGSRGDELQAQFWTRSLAVSGEGTFVMAVDPEAAVARPQLGVALIR